jgi:hypothetical protein
MYHANRTLSLLGLKQGVDCGWDMLIEATQNLTISM